MKRMVALGGLLALCITSLLAEKIRRDWNRDLDFQQFETFAWMEDIKLPFSPKRDPQEIDRLIRGSVEAELQRHGMRKAESADRADLNVKYFAFARAEMETQEVDEKAGMGPNRIPYGHWRPFGSTRIESNLRRQGTLIVDLVNPSNDQLVWRGTLEKSFKDGDELMKKLPKHVKKLFKNFPRKNK
ncbi:MAG TPA: DUF4136 domain-containing protein [Acidobacteriota bacterium]|nr:DUF4136 domain-containing protein [Acidobacteriota bacterium]